MNSAFVVINKYVNKKQYWRRNVLTNVSAQALRDNLECANIYKGSSPKKKTDLIEMIVYGCTTEKIKKKN